MKRRSLLASTMSAAVLPATLRAQQKAMPVVGFLGATSPEALRSSLVAFHRGLAETNHVEGRDIAFEYRWAEEQYDRLPGLALELVQHNVTAIVAATAPSALAAKAATATKPIIFFSGGDPVEQGIVASFNRPGGNLTGACVFINDLGPKQLELLHEVAPRMAAIGFLYNPGVPGAGQQVKGMEDAARAVGKRIVFLQARVEGDIDGAVTNLAEQHGDALIVGADPFLGVQYEKILTLSARHRIAVVSGRLLATAGGLIGYGNKVEDAYREVGVYTGRILNGERPADLPVLRATKFELAINLKTAKTLGLTIPPSILARANEVIE